MRVYRYTFALGIDPDGAKIVLVVGRTESRDLWGDDRFDTLAFDWLNRLTATPLREPGGWWTLESVETIDR